MKILLLLIMITIPNFFLRANDSFIIKNIHIEGLYRISKDFIISKIPFYSYKDYKINTNDISILINSIMSTKHFNEIKVIFDESNSNLIIKLKENPIILSINFVNNKLIKNDFLKEIFIEKDLYINNELDNNKLFNLINSINNSYKNIGNYNTNINVELLPCVFNQIKLVINFNEGKNSFIKEINIKGNDNIKSNTILNNFRSFNNKLNFLKIIFKSLYISKDFKKDLESIKNLYEENGYFDFSINNKKIIFSKDKSEVSIHLDIFEGNKYNIKNFELIGDFDSSYFNELNDILNKYIYKNTFDVKRIKFIKNEIENLLISKGYSFPIINTKVINDNIKSNESILQFNILCGYKFNLRNILIDGNKKTLDKVIRREIYQSEFSTFDKNLVYEDVNRLNKLKLFKKVDIKTCFTDKDNINNKSVDLLFNIDEMSFSGFKVGFSLNEKYNPNIKFDFMQSNFLGKNNLVSLIFNYNRNKTNIDFVINDPFFIKDKRIKVSSKIFYSKFLEENEEYDLLNINYGISNSVNFFIHNNFWSDYELVFHINEIKVNCYDYCIFDDLIPLNHLKEVFLSDEKKYNKYIPILNKSCDLLIITSFNYDNLDKHIFPTNGRKIMLNCKSTLPILSDNKYCLLNLISENYFTDTNFINLTFFNRTQIYSVTNLFKKNIPFYNNFYLDKIDQVRGVRRFLHDDSECINYIDSSILEKDNIFNSTKMIIKNELCIPTNTILGHKYNDFARLSMFTDFGFEIESKKEIDSLLDIFNIYECQYIKHVHLSTGLTLRISSSPSTLIDISYIIPIKKCSPYEKIEKFQFNINKKW